MVEFRAITAAPIRPRFALISKRLIYCVSESLSPLQLTEESVLTKMTDLPPSSLLDPLNIPPYNPPNDPPKLTFPHALSTLIESTFPPLSPHPGVWCFDDKVIAVYDRYNKSTTHFLVIPRDGRIKDVEDLTADDRGELMGEGREERGSSKKMFVRCITR